MNANCQTIECCLTNSNLKWLRFLLIIKCQSKISQIASKCENVKMWNTCFKLVASELYMEPRMRTILWSFALFLIRAFIIIWLQWIESACRQIISLCVCVCVCARVLPIRIANMRPNEELIKEYQHLKSFYCLYFESWYFLLKKLKVWRACLDRRCALVKLWPYHLISKDLFKYLKN